MQQAIKQCCGQGLIIGNALAHCRKVIARDNDAVYFTRPEQRNSKRGQVAEFGILRLPAISLGSREAQHPGAKKQNGLQDHPQIVPGTA